MKRLVGVALILAAGARAEFVEIGVDASSPAGEIRPVFGIDAPADPRQAKLLLERGAQLPTRLGPGAALRAELARAPFATWSDPIERAVYDLRAAATPGEGPFVWTLPTPSGSLREAVAALAAAVELQDGRAEPGYHRRPSGTWFDDEGRPLAVLSALELGARMSATARRLPLRIDPRQRIRGLAGVSPDGEAIQILLIRQEANDEAPPQASSYVLFVRNLPWGKDDFRTERFRLDAGRPGELVSKGAGRGGLARLSARFSAPAVELIVLRKQAAPPGAGVIRRRSKAPPGPPR